MPVLEGVDYKYISVWRCPNDNTIYRNVKVGMYNPHRITGWFMPPHIFTRRCCHQYFLESGENITEAFHQYERSNR